MTQTELKEYREKFASAYVESRIKEEGIKEEDAAGIRMMSEFVYQMSDESLQCAYDSGMRHI